jgi:hypothetical protein
LTEQVHPGLTLPKCYYSIPESLGNPPLHLEPNEGESLYFYPQELAFNDHQPATTISTADAVTRFDISLMQAYPFSMALSTIDSEFMQ